MLSLDQGWGVTDTEEDHNEVFVVGELPPASLRWDSRADKGEVNTWAITIIRDVRHAIRASVGLTHWDIYCVVALITGRGISHGGLRQVG